MIIKGAAFERQSIRSICDVRDNCMVSKYFGILGLNFLSVMLEATDGHIISGVLV